jgi:hypothetical protein
VAVIGSRAGVSTGFHLLAKGSDTDTAVLTWTDAQYAFYDFGCFDSVPSPRRAAATSQSGQPEFFVVARCGTLQERAIVQFETAATWVPWAPMQLPQADSVATDVDASLAADETTLLYVVDRGTAYVRHRDGPHDNAPFGPWRVAATGCGAILAASTRSDGRQQLFTLDAGGHPRTALQTSDALDAPFAAWQDFDASSVPRLIELESPVGRTLSELFALDDAGKLWTRLQKGDGSFTPWSQLSLPGSEHRFKLLSSAALPSTTDEVIALAAIEDAVPATVYARQRWNGTWQDDWQPVQ